MEEKKLIQFQNIVKDFDGTLVLKGINLDIYENEFVIEQKVLKMLKLIGLEGYEKKDVTLLSGGQQQRIAIARALVNEPKVLLLDEPLGALDLKLRKEMQYELKKIQQEVGITFIYVTHDQEEALTMSDKIVVMKDGEIQQVGTPTDIYNEPENRYVANFIGESNIIPGVMLDDYKVMFDDISFDCVDFGFKKNEKVDVVIRPEDLDIVKEEDGKMTGIVKSVLFKGVHYEIMVETVPGTTVSVMMNVTEEHDVSSRMMSIFPSIKLNMIYRRRSVRIRLPSPQAPERVYPSRCLWCSRNTWRIQRRTKRFPPSISLKPWTS